MPLPEGFTPIDFVQFHTTQLPALLVSDRNALVARATARLRSLAFRLPGEAAYTYRPSDGGITITAGDETADTVIEIDLDSWQGLVHELEAPAGLLYAQRVHCRHGNALNLMAWETALRALYNGRPPYDPTAQILSGQDNRALDPQAVFTSTSDREAMAEFLRAAGYLFVRNVFGADELAALLDEAEELRREACQGDKLSWWGKNAAGKAVLTRVTRGVAKPRLGALPTDARLRRLKDLADESLVYRRGEGQGVTVIYKNPGMAEGLGDLPWHRDCGMGGHAVMCPVLIASIYLTAATPETGELAMLPGSHHASMNAHEQSCDLAAAAAHFRAQPGDVSLHFSDTVHAAPPPTDMQLDRYRISAVVGFARPGARHHRGEGSYNDVLHQRDDGQIQHIEAAVKRV